MWEIALGVLAIVSIILVAVESTVSLTKTTLMSIYIVDLVICIVFAVDFIVRLKASDRKSIFMKTNWYEILAMVPAISLYALGAIPAISAGLRLLRLVRVVFVLARMKRAMSTSKGFFQRSNLLAMLGITVGIIFIGALTVYILDSGLEGAHITNFSDAVWWSISTVTTVGYGDIVPHSIGGRIIGMFLMVVGIGVMAAFISQVSASLVESRIKKPAEKTDLKTEMISGIKSKLDNLESLSESDLSLLIKMIQTLKHSE